MGISRIVDTVKGRVHRTFYNANTDAVGASLKEVYNGEQFDRKSLVWYFSLGYVPGDLTLFQNIFCLPGGAKCEIGNGKYKVIDRFYYEDLVTPGKFDGVDETEILKIAHTTIVEVVEHLYSKNKDVVLALTGGLDSRLLLGALLEVTEARNLQGFSWGAKDSYDYEIGKRLGKKFGVEHKAYDLNTIPFGIDQLMKFADMSDANTNLFEQPPIESLIRDFENRNLWLGVVGGTASGSNLPISSLENPESYFLKSESQRTGILASTAESLLGESIQPSDVRELTKDYKARNFDSIDIYNHHERLIGHAIYFRGFNYSLPFATDSWLAFSLSLPMKYRNRNRTILIELIKKNYRSLSLEPSANRRGLSLQPGRIESLLEKTKHRFFIGKKLNKRRKYVNILDLIQSNRWHLLIDALEINKKSNGDFKVSLTDLLNELTQERIDHVKTIELLISLATIKNKYSISS